MIDCIPTVNINGNKRNEDLKLIDFTLIHFYYKGNSYHVPVYILTDGIVSFKGECYETMIRIGFIEYCKFLDVQGRCFTKLEAYKQHKIIYKKLIKGFYNEQIRKIVDESGVVCKNG